MQVNTLLIVESPTIERIITGFKIPGLDVASTAGYSWKPRPDFKNGKLTGIAGPDLLPYRNTIRSKSLNAGRIILATDSDPSGRFIATCLARDLSSKQLFRGYINLLSPRAVSRTVDTAVPWKNENVQPLINRLFVQKTFRDESNKGGICKHAGLTPSLIHLALFPFFYGERENPSRPSGMPNVHYRIFRPWNTAVFISRYPYRLQSGTGDRSKMSFAEIQDILNRLFTSVPENIESGLISYPRTTSDGFYKATWDKMHHQNLINRNAEDLCPQVLWNVIPDDSPHEALHPIRMELSPREVRPYLQKNLYDAYRIIHKETSSVFMKPMAIHDAGIQTELIPELSIERLLQWLARYALLPPSRFGVALDNLIAERWITASNGIVDPGLTMSGFRGLTARTESGELLGLIKSLNEKIEESQNTAELVPDIRRMMKFTSEKPNV